MLLLDFEMPGIDYLTFLNELRQTVPDCCIIGTGVRESPALAEIAIQQEEICDYLIKPFSIEQLKMGVYRSLKRLKLIKQEKEFSRRVENVGNYLYNVANNLTASTVFISYEGTEKKDRRGEYGGRKKTTRRY